MLKEMVNKFVLKDAGSLSLGEVKQRPERAVKAERIALGDGGFGKY
jgi:hypothetical protein